MGLIYLSLVKSSALNLSHVLHLLHVPNCHRCHWNTNFTPGRNWGPERWRCGSDLKKVFSGGLVGAWAPGKMWPGLKLLVYDLSVVRQWISDGIKKRTECLSSYSESLRCSRFIHNSKKSLQSINTAGISLLLYITVIMLTLIKREIVIVWLAYVPVQISCAVLFIWMEWLDLKVFT